MSEKILKNTLTKKHMFDFNKPKPDNLSEVNSKLFDEKFARYRENQRVSRSKELRRSTTDKKHMFDFTEPKPDNLSVEDSKLYDEKLARYKKNPRRSEEVKKSLKSPAAKKAAHDELFKKPLDVQKPDHNNKTLNNYTGPVYLQIKKIADFKTWSLKKKIKFFKIKIANEKKMRILREMALRSRWHKQKLKQLEQIKKATIVKKSINFTTLNPKYIILPPLYLNVIKTINYNPYKKIEVTEYLKNIEKNLFYLKKFKFEEEVEVKIDEIQTRLEKYNSFLSVIKKHLFIIFNIISIINKFNRYFVSNKSTFWTQPYNHNNKPSLMFTIQKLANYLKIWLKIFKKIPKYLKAITALIYSSSNTQLYFSKWLIIKISNIFWYYKQYIANIFFKTQKKIIYLIRIGRLFSSANLLNYQPLTTTQQKLIKNSHDKKNEKQKPIKAKLKTTINHRYLDHIYNSYWFGKFINMFIRSGKKRKAITNVNTAFDSIKYTSNLLIYKVLLVVLARLRPVFRLRKYKIRKGREEKMYPILTRLSLLYMIILIWIKYSVFAAYSGLRRTGIRSISLTIRNIMLEYTTNFKNHKFVNRNMNYAYAAVENMANRRFNRRGKNKLKGF